MKKSIVIIIVLIEGLTVKTFAQSNTMYYMSNVPQSYQVNPATQPQCNFFIGSLPLLNTSYAISNTAVSPTDLFWYDSELDSVVTPLTSNANLDKFLSKINATEELSIKNNLNLLSFGFRSHQMYFCFDATIHNSQSITYPKSLLEFLLLGNENGRTYDFSDLNYELLTYAEFSANISRKFGDILSIGVRPKVFYGLATINTQKNNFTLQSSTDQLVINAHSQLNMAITGLPLPLNDDGTIDFGKVADGIDTTYKNPNDLLKAFNKNRGFGVDVGINITPIERLQLSASLLDLGYIKWADKPQSVILDGSYSFQGLNLNLMDSSKKFDQIIDTIKKNLSTHGASDAFRTNLNPKLIVGGRIFITKKIDVGVLSRTEFKPNKVDQDIIFLADLRPLRGFSLSASYSLTGKGKSSIGLGGSIKIGPFNGYFISDYNPFKYDRLTKSGKQHYIESPSVKIGNKDRSARIPAILPVDVYKFSFLIGTNIVIGCNRVKKLNRDTPIFKSTEWMY